MMNSASVNRSNANYSSQKRQSGRDIMERREENGEARREEKRSEEEETREEKRREEKRREEKRREEKRRKGMIYDRREGKKR
jgi:hypothetical protein